jgi:hypothetical protein
LPNEGSHVSFRHIRRWVVALAACSLALPATAFARDGVGRVDVQPDHVVAGSTGNTLTFTYTADTTGVHGPMRFVVPPGWTPPRASSPSRPGYVKVGRRGCSGKTRLLWVHGQTVALRADCRKGASLRITYAGVTAPTLAAEGYTFLTETTAPGRKGKARRLVPLSPEKQPVIPVVGATVDHYQITTTSLVIAGTPFSLTVRPVDAYGNTARGSSGNYYSSTVSFTSSDPTATLPAPYTMAPGDFGTHTFRGLVLNTPGNQTIHVSDPGGVMGDSLPIAVSPY